MSKNSKRLDKLEEILSVKKNSDISTTHHIGLDENLETVVRYTKKVDGADISISEREYLKIIRGRTDFNIKFTDDEDDNDN